MGFQDLSKKQRRDLGKKIMQQNLCLDGPSVDNPTVECQSVRDGTYEIIFGEYKGYAITDPHIVVKGEGWTVLAHHSGWD